MEPHRFYLKIAMEEAKASFEKDTYPVGAVIVAPNGKVISKGRNQVYQVSEGGDFTSHAEIEAIRRAGGQLMRKENFKACTLYTTLEPCLMCCGAILHARITQVIWIRDDTIDGALRCLHNNTHPLSDLYCGLCALKFGASKNGAADGWNIEREFGVPKIFSVKERDLEREMDDMMKEWNLKKKEVVDRWLVQASHV